MNNNDINSDTWECIMTYTCYKMKFNVGLDKYRNREAKLHGKVQIRILQIKRKN